MVRFLKAAGFLGAVVLSSCSNKIDRPQEDEPVLVEVTCVDQGSSHYFVKWWSDGTSTKDVGPPASARYFEGGQGTYLYFPGYSGSCE